MRLWAKLRHYLMTDKGKCQNCGEALTPGDSGRLHAACVQEYDDRMAW